MNKETGGKAIKITPDEVLFESVCVGQSQLQQITLKNILSAPVEIVTIIYNFKSLKSSNSDRIEVEPKFKKLAPFESFQAEITLKVLKQDQGFNLLRPFAKGATKIKETIFIQSDFFDQKVNIVLVPSQTTQTTQRDLSQGSSARAQTQVSLGKYKKEMQTSKRDASPNLQTIEIEKEIQEKSLKIEELNFVIEKQQEELNVAYSELEQEQQKRAEIEQKLYNQQNNSNKEQLDQIRVLLREREPSLEQLMEVTLKKERDVQERKDQKVLEILKIKDRQMEDLQQKLVSQEAEYGKLAQLFQELKRQSKQQEEEKERIISNWKIVEQQFDQANNKLISYEKGREYQRMLELEDKLEKAHSFLQNYEEQLNEKIQVEQYYQESFERLNLQNSEKDQCISQLEQELQDQRNQYKQIQEQNIMQVQQIQQLSLESLEGHNQSIALFKNDQELQERINKLNDEKSQLVNTVDQLRKQHFDQEDSLRYIFERLVSLRGSTQNIEKPQGKQISSMIERRVEEVARFIKEMENDNIDLNQKYLKQQEILKSREAELNDFIEENQTLQVQNKKCKTKNIGAQTSIELEDMEAFESVRDQIKSLKHDCDRLRNENSSITQKLKATEKDLDQSNTELMLVVRSGNQSKQGHNHKNSVTTQLTEISGIQEHHQPDEVISRLNAKITQLKMNEERLMEENAQLKHAMSMNYDNGTSTMRSQISQQPQRQQERSQIGLEERIGEYEVILLEQRNLLVNLEEENANLRNNCKEMEQSMQNNQQQSQLRLKNLGEVNKKYEQMQLLQSSLASNNTFTQSTKSTTQAETERMRQYAQSLELNQMGMRHQNEELVQECELLKHQLKQANEISIQNEKNILRMKQDFKLVRVGLSDGDQNNKLGSKVVEQRNTIKYLQGLLLRAKQDFEMLHQRGGQQNKIFEDSSKVSEKLRKDLQQSVLLLVDLKDEYLNKLQTIGEQNETSKQKLLSENALMQRKNEQLYSQIQFIESKEFKMIQIIDDLKATTSQELNDKDQRIKEQEEMLIQKEEAISELEREIRTKERSLQERQEQLSVLITTLESEHSTDETRQKLLNISAELCSLKAIEAQMERQVNELTHLLKKGESSLIKQTRLNESFKLKEQDLNFRLQRIEQDYEDLKRSQLETINENEEKEREINDLKYKIERDQFQIQMKEESNQQFKDQLRRAEQGFKEEIERLRKQMYEGSLVKPSLINENNKDITLRLAVQQLHVTLYSYMESSQRESESNVIKELERVLGCASQNVEQLQSDLDKAKLQISQHQSHFKIGALNKILISRNEQLQEKATKQLSMIMEREEQRESFIKQKEDQLSQQVKQLEQKLDFQTKQNSKLEEIQSTLESQNVQLQQKVEELSQGQSLFSQEVENQKQSFERQAELTVDERFKSKHELIKTFFDSNITRILLNTNSSNNEKCIELGRQICSLKLVIDKLEQQSLARKAEVQALELNLSHYKEQYQSLDHKLKDQSHKFNSQILKLKKNEQSQQKEKNKRKNEQIQLDKELLKAKEQLENKNRDIFKLHDQLNKLQQIKEIPNEGEDTFKDEHIENLNIRIQELQEKLLEVRSLHIQELEELRTQYDLEMFEAKRSLQTEKENLEKRFKPGYAPGDIMETNQHLEQRISELKQHLEKLMQENIILRKKVEQEKLGNEGQRNEITAYRQALMELESTMVEMTNNPQVTMQQLPTRDSNEHNRTVKQSQQKEEKKTKKTKSKQQLHFSKETYQNQSLVDEMQASTYRINQYDNQSSLNVSAITSVVANPRLSTNQYSQIGKDNGRQFVVNPPQLVRALIQSKVQELQLKKKCDEAIKVEVELRSQIKHIIQSKPLPSNDQELQKRMIELEMENEDLKINRLQQSDDYLKFNLISKQEDYPKNNALVADYIVLVESIIALTTYIASIEGGNGNNEEDPTIEEAQRLVLKTLVSTMLQEKGQLNIQLVPTEEQDKRVWYLELLDQQVNQSENVISQLQSFIKKLQIDISGNLHSAAQIKAASMDLAQNTMKTSEEVKQLRQIVGLIKHDLQQNMLNKRQTMKQETMTIGQRTLNPFVENSKQQEIESLTNQLTITERVKKTLENEIVSLKINQQQEVQSLSSQLSQVVDQRNSLLQTNEELHDRVQMVQNQLEKIKNEYQVAQEVNQDTSQALAEKEKERQAIAQNKTATSKHLQKLQNDMHEWRKQTDEHLKTKEKQMQDLSTQNQAMIVERDRFKAENQMLRRNEKERKPNNEIKKLQLENQELIERLQTEQEERQKEIQFWVSERATMREMIDQLESDRVEGAIEGAQGNDQQLKAIKKKSMKKIKHKDFELKNKEKEVQACRDELNKVKLSQTQLEQKIRESSTKQTEAEERVKYYQQKYKECELERDLVLAEKQNAINSNDIGAQQIQQELNSLRECFAKLKVERDNLLYEIDSQNARDKEWRTTVDKLNEELQSMEKHLFGREKDQSTQIKILDQKNQTMLADLKFMKQELDKLKERIKEKDLEALQYEKRIHEGEMRQQELVFGGDESQRQMNELRSQIRGREDMIANLESQMLVIEAAKMKEIQGINHKLEDVREANAQIIVLYENQLADLKIKFISDKKKTEQQTEQMFSIAQREAVIKNLKKELNISKTQLSKSKYKLKSLKLSQQHSQNQENNSSTLNQKRQKLRSVILRDQIPEQETIDKNVLKVSQMLLSDEGYPGLLEQLQKTSTVLSKCTQLQAELEKNQNWTMVLSQQLQDQQSITSELQQKLDLALKSTLKESKLQKQSQINNEQSKASKQEIKQLQNELEQVKLEWVNPADYKGIQEKLKEASNQVKTLSAELQRKKDVIVQLKQQREHTELEANQILTDLEGLKDDNIKLQKLIRENNKNANLVKELKSSNDYLKQQEKRLKDEIQSLNEKVRVIKLESSRKDQIAKEYKDKLDQIQEEVSLSKDKVGEIERLKELTKKLKLETEIKDNHLKSLKQRLEHTEEELEHAKSVTQSNMSNSQSQSNLFESQLKTSKNKLKKYETHLKKSLEALRLIGKELSKQESKPVQKMKGSQNKSDNPMILSEFEREMYKDSVNILGVSMDDLEDFINPTANANTSNLSSSKLIEKQSFIQKLDKAVDIPDSLNQDIESICNYCVKLIGEYFSTMMKAIVVEGFGPPEVMKVGTVPIPVCNKDEVLIKVEATARSGKYPPPKGVTDIIGLECAGYIVNQTTLLGDKTKKVMALLSGGGYAEYAKVNINHVMNVPSNFNIERAVAIPEVWLTAYQLLRLVAEGKQNEKALILAAASGVGTSLIQLCKKFNIESFAVASTPEKLDTCLNKCLGMDSRWVMYGTMGGLKVKEASFVDLILKRGSIIASTLRSRNDSYKANLVQDFSLNCLKDFENRLLIPVIDQILNLSEVVKAHKIIESNTNVGKIILKFDL